MRNFLYNAYVRSMIFMDQVYYLINAISEVNEEIFGGLVGRDVSDEDLTKSFYFQINNKLFKWGSSNDGNNSISVSIHQIDTRKYLKIPEPRGHELIFNVRFRNIGEANFELSRNHAQSNDTDIHKIMCEYMDLMVKIYHKTNRRLKALTTNMVSDTENYTWCPVDEAIDSINMNTAHIISEDFVEDSITLDEFLKLDLEDVNYNHTVYRITDEAMLPVLKEHFEKILMLGKFYRFENVQANRLFYIENCDLQDIQEVYGDNIWDIRDEKYRFINIIH